MKLPDSCNAIINSNNKSDIINGQKKPTVIEGKTKTIYKNKFLERRKAL